MGPAYVVTAKASVKAAKNEPDQPVLQAVPL